MGRPKPHHFDLVMIQAVTDRVRAVRDLIRAEATLDAARRANAPGPIAEARRRRDLSTGRASVTRSALDAAIATEASELE